MAASSATPSTACATSAAPRSTTAPMGRRAEQHAAPVAHGDAGLGKPSANVMASRGCTGGLVGGRARLREAGDRQPVRQPIEARAVRLEQHVHLADFAERCASSTLSSVSSESSMPAIDNDGDHALLVASERARRIARERAARRRVADFHQLATELARVARAQERGLSRACASAAARGWGNAGAQSAGTRRILQADLGHDREQVLASEGRDARQTLVQRRAERKSRAHVEAAAPRACSGDM